MWIVWVVWKVEICPELAMQNSAKGMNCNGDREEPSLRQSYPLAGKIGDTLAFVFDLET